MCGIAGAFSIFSVNQGDIDIISRMNSIQKHRGPDDEGLFSDRNCVLGHRRLSIIDLSKDGHQPFTSEDGRYIMVFNGEIYNYIELREELKNLGYVFKTATDTEVLLKSYIHYGDTCMSKFNGMFAFAIYDSQQKKLFLARDRVGVKPLYYSINGGKIFFASEIKALRNTIKQSYSVNESALFDYLCFNRTDISGETFLNEVSRLPKGCYAVFNESLEIQKWWNPESFIQTENSDSESQISDTVEEILISSIKLRMRSDVPVGSCLSGGLDSSIIVGILYQKDLIKYNYKTFTVSYPGFKLDETNYIDLLNKKYPFKNFRTYPNSNIVFDNFRDFVYMNDEPSTSPTFYSQYEVMRLAKENNVTVLLDGQGGDENFAGYQYFHGFFFTELFKKHRYAKLLLELYKSFIRKQEKEAFQTFLFQIIPSFQRKYLLYKTLPHIQKDFFYNHINKSVIFNDFFTAKDLNTSLVRHFQYKLEHLLRPEDRNSMAFSIEARVPYLDYRLIEYLLSVPGSYKIKRGENKLIQKKAVGKYTIPEIINRLDKVGFGTPGEDWMKDEKWRIFTNENYNYVCDKFPHIFKNRAILKDNLFDRWKVNQIATWMDVFNN